MEINKNSGPDGFPAYFYQEFWVLVRWHLKGLLDVFNHGGRDIARLNYGIITRVPKTNDAKEIQKFRPICILNVSIKIITMVMMNRLSKKNPMLFPLPRLLSLEAFSSWKDWLYYVKL